MKRLGVFVLCVFVLFFSFLEAQDTRDTKASQDSLFRSQWLRPVLVIGNKTRQGWHRMAKSSTYINAMRMQESSSKDLAQLLNESGFMIGSAYSNASKNKEIFMQGSNNRHVLTLIDGVPVRNPRGVNDGAYDLRLFDEMSFDSIEILEGCHASLYGSNALAGVIGLRTPEASLAPIAVRTSIAGGTYDTAKIGLGFNGTPIKNNGFVLSYVWHGYRVQNEGISSVNARAGTSTPSNFDKDGFLKNGVDTKLSLAFPRINLSLSPYFRQNYYRHDYDGGSFVENNVNRAQYDFLMTGLNAKWLQNKGAVYLKTSWQRTFEHRRSAFGTNLPSFSKSSGNLRYVETYTEQDIHARIRLIGGVEYRHSESRNGGQYNAAEVTSPYLTARLQFLEDIPLFLEAGGRYLLHSETAGYFSYHINPFYLIGKRAKVYAAFSTGYVVPSLYQLYHQNYGNAALETESAQVLDIGYAYTPEDVNGWDFALRTSAFVRDTENTVVWSGGRYFNLSEETHYGFMIEPTLYFGKKLRTSLQYRFVDGRSETKSMGDTPAQERTFLHKRPRNAYRFSIRYTPTERLLASINVQSISNRTDLTYSAAAQSTIPIRLAPYALVDMYVSYKVWQSRLNLFVDLKNILDNRDYEETYGYATLGFNAMAGLRFNY